MSEPTTPTPASPDPAAGGGEGGGGRGGSLMSSIAHYAVAMFATQASGLLRSYLAARLLGPTVFGVWLGLRLIVDYGAHAHLGVIFGMHRNVPLLRGRGDLPRAATTKRTAYTLTLVAAVASAVATVLFGWLARPAERWVYCAIAAVLFTNLMRGYVTTAFKADSRFRELKLSSLLGGACTVATLPLIAWLGLEGFLLCIALPTAVEITFLFRREARLPLGVDSSVLRELLGVGLLTLLIVLGSTLLTTIDRTVILQTLDETRLGYYGIAFIVATNFLISLTAIPHAVIYPRLSELYGRTGRPADLAPLLFTPLRSMSLGFASLIGALALALPSVVALALPKYGPGVDAARIALFATYSYVVVGVTQACFYTLNWYKLYISMLVGAAGASYVLARLLVARWPSLEAVALGCGGGLLLYLVAVVIGAFAIMRRPLRDAIKMLGLTLAPLAYVGALVLGIDHLLGRFWAAESIRRGLVAELLLLVAVTPLLWPLARRLWQRRAAG